MMKKDVVLTQEQLVAVAELVRYKEDGAIPFFPSRYAWVEELLYLEQVEHYMMTGFNYLTINTYEEFLGTVHSNIIFKRWIPEKLRLKLSDWHIRYILFVWSVKNAYEIATSPSIDKEIPTVDDITMWICDCGLEAEDPGMGCLPCFTGCRDLVYVEGDEEALDEFELEREGHLGGAFDSWEQEILWRNGGKL